MKSNGKLSENLKATLAFGLASFVTSGINYLTTPVFTRLLSTSEYGVVSIYNSLYSIVSVAATLTLARPGIISVGLYDHRDNRWKYLSSMLGCVAASTAVTALLTGLFWNVLKPVVRLPLSLMILLLLTCLLQPAVLFWTSKQRYEYRYQSTVLVTIGSAALSQAFSIAMVAKLRGSGLNLAAVRLWSAGVVNLLVALVLYVYICVMGGQYVNVPLWKKTLRFALPLIPHYFGFALLSGTDKLMIGRMVGDGEAGIYSLASLLSHIGSLLWSALCVSFTPFMYSKMGERSFRQIDSAVKPLLELVGAACAFISLMAPDVIRLMSTTEYLKGVYVVPAAMAGLFMHVMYDIFSNVSFFHKKSVRIMLATLSAAALNVVLNYVCILRFGYIAASYTTFVSYLFLACIHYFNSRRIEKERVFDPRFLARISVLVSGACLLCNSLYAWNWLRYVLAAGMALAVLRRRNRYIDALSNMKV